MKTDKKEKQTIPDHDLALVKGCISATCHCWHCEPQRQEGSGRVWCEWSQLCVDAGRSPPAWAAALLYANPRGQRAGGH